MAVIELLQQGTLSENVAIVSARIHDVLLVEFAGRPEEARTLFAEVIAARRAAASAEGASAAQLNACALLLLECPVEELRNPADALKFGEQASAATDNADPIVLNTLARALFQTGQAEKAAEVQKKAISLLPEASPTRAEYEERLAEYSTSGKT